MPALRYSPRTMGRLAQRLKRMQRPPRAVGRPAGPQPIGRVGGLAPDYPPDFAPPAPTPLPEVPQPPGEPAPAPAPAPPPPTPRGGPLSWNPQLPAHPLGAFTDAQYEADEASLRSETIKKYQDVLKQLGYMSPTGEHIKGRVELGAESERTRLRREQGLAREQSTFGSRERGTLFSGVRGIEQARAEHPYVTDLADIDIELPTQLGDLYEEALGILGDYETERNALLAAAVGRFEPDEGVGEPPPDPDNPMAPGPVVLGPGGKSTNLASRIARKYITRGLPRSRYRPPRPRGPRPPLEP